MTSARTSLLRALLAGTAFALAAAAPARAADAGTTIQVSEVRADDAPQVQVAFTKSDDDPAVPDLDITENGHAVSDVHTYAGAIGDVQTDPRPVVVLALDASESMRDGKLDAAKAAANAFLDQARSIDRVGLVVFNGSARVVVPPTTDLAAVRTAVAAVTPAFGTKMWDAVDDAVGAFPSDATSRDVILLTDGAENGSTVSLGDAMSHATDAQVHVTTVGMPGSGYDQALLTDVATRTGGQFQRVDAQGDLSGLFARLGQQLLHDYWLTYRSSEPAGHDVVVRITPAGGGTTVAVTETYRAPAAPALPGQVRAAPLEPAPAVHPLLPVPTGPLGRLLAAAPFALLALWFGWTRVVRTRRRQLDARFAPYGINHEDGVAAAEDDATTTVSARERLLGLTESLLGRSAWFARARVRLEQANLPLREAELLWGMIGSGLVLGAIATLTIGQLVLAPVFAVVLGYAPMAWVRFKAKRRRAAFEDQLPDVLSTVVASLRAGHSFNQSLNAVIREAPEPTRQELQRVMAEASLGLPVEDALTSMADRMGSADFDFAVTTVNIQRTVGGSLSEILEMVGETVRGRQQFAKKVKALTAMGSASMYVLLGMPVFIALVLSVVNRSYMAPLFTQQAGHYLLAAGAFFMLLGYLACRKIVDVKV